jgi:hypothetical protein
MSEEIYKLKYLKYKAKYLKLLGGMVRRVSDGPISQPDSLIANNFRSIVDCLNHMFKRPGVLKIPGLVVYAKTNNFGEYYFNLHTGEDPRDNSTKVSHFTFHRIPRTEAQNQARNRRKSSWHYTIDAGADKGKVFNVYFQEVPNASNIVITFGDISDLPSGHQAILDAFITCTYDLINGNELLF